MEKSNEPTYSQIQTIYRWISWFMTTTESRKTVHWLKDNASRREVSLEIKRLYELHHQHKLDRDSLFEGKVWEGFER